MTDRLEELRDKWRAIYEADVNMTAVEAWRDIQWLISEVERLQEDNITLNAFVVRLGLWEKFKRELVDD